MIINKSIGSFSACKGGYNNTELYVYPVRVLGMLGDLLSTLKISFGYLSTDSRDISDNITVF